MTTRGLRTQDFRYDQRTANRAAMFFRAPAGTLLLTAIYRDGGMGSAPGGFFGYSPDMPCWNGDDGQVNCS